MSLLKGAVFAVTAFAFGALPALPEDLTIISSTHLGKDRTVTTTEYLSSEKTRTSNGDHDTIVDHSTGKMTLINNSKKEYYETSLAEMAAMFENLDKQMGGNPLGGLLGGAVSEVRVQKVEGAKKVAGYDCDHYVLAMGDDMKFDIWSAPALTPPQQYFDARKAAYAAMGPMGRRFDRMFEEMRKIKGFPLSTGINAKMMMLKIDTLSEATEVKKGKVPASAFDVPAGFRQKESPFKRKK